MNFKSFEKSLLQAIDVEPHQEDRLLERSIPVVSQKLSDIQGELSSVRNQMTNLDSRFSEFDSRITSLFSRPLQMIGMVSLGTPVSTNMDIQNTNISSSNEAEAEAVQSVVLSAASSSTIAASLSPPSYSMSRGIQTVADLYREWTQGINGGPAIQDLERNWGAQWRKSEKDRKFFARRRVIIDEINRMIEFERKTPLQAVSELDQKLLANKASINWLSKFLSKR